MSQKIVLITGASSGIGKLIAMGFLKRGDIVYATGRHLNDLKAMEQEGARILEVDVSKDSDVSHCVETIIKEQGRIDVLYCNAGYGVYGPIEMLPLHKVINQFDVNLFGIARMVQQVLPYMRGVKSGRVIITASVASHISIAGMGWYSASKYALFAMAEALRQEVKTLGIDIVVVQPGPLRTGFEERAVLALDALTLPADYHDLMKKFRPFVIDRYRFAPSPNGTARKMVRLGCKKRVRFAYTTTYAGVCYLVLNRILGPAIMDRLIFFLIGHEVDRN